MSQRSWGRGVFAFSAATLLAACIPIPATTPQPAASAVATAAAGTTPLRFKSGALQVGTGDSRSLIALLELNGQAISSDAASALSFRTSNPAVAGVGADGSLKGLTSGTTVVTVFVNADPRVSATLNVNVVGNQGALQITITPDTSVLEPGEQVTLKAEVHLATGAVNSNVHWTSSDNTIATVNDTTGQVNALKLGRVTIRAVYAGDDAYQQVAEIQVVADKSQALPSPAPGGAIFGNGESPMPSATPNANAGPIAPGHWVHQTTGITDDLSEVRFVNESTGFAMGDHGALVKTTDGGATWTTSYPIDLGFQYVTTFDFASAQVGMAVAGGKTFRTTDGGATWTALNALPGAANGNAWVRCYGSKLAYAIVGGTPYKSNDAGATWETITVPYAATEPLQAITAYGDATWFAAGSKVYGKIDGIGWLGAPMPVVNVNLLQFISPTVGFVLRQSTSPNYTPVYLTSDGGKNFTALMDVFGLDMDWADAGHGWIIRADMNQYNQTSTSIRGTQDGALTWLDTPIDAPNDHALAGIDFVSPTAGWAVGKAGTILRYQPNL